jgi:3-oxoacyl-[acyl-carrier-protein] synthase III
LINYPGMKQARIIGTGSYVPERVLTNRDLEQMVDTSDEWIVTRSGIRERRIAAADQATSDLSVEAGRRALEAAGVRPEELDLIIVATLTPDYLTPNTASLVQHRLGATRAAAFSIEVGCTGYIAGLSVAKAYVEGSRYRRVLMIAADKLSSIVDYTDRTTCVLFGDGAAAALVADAGAGLAVRHVSLGSDGAQANLLMIPGGGSREPASEASVRSKRHFLAMDGKEVFKHAVRRMEAAAHECMQATGWSQQQIDWLVPHQANDRILEAVGKRFEIPADHIVNTLYKYGNTSASSLGIALDELVRQGKVENGQKLLLVAFGAGFAWGGAALERVEA